MEKDSLSGGVAEMGRKKVLKSLDDARFQTYHIKALAITMVTFFRYLSVSRMIGIGGFASRLFRHRDRKQQS